MGIQFLNGFMDTQSYYRTRQEIAAQTVNVQQDQQTAQQAVPAQDEQSVVSSKPLQNDTHKGITDLEDISLTFQKDDNFDQIGSESGLANLDVQKAISDMRRDQVLQEYQYFVGSSQGLFSSEDGLVIPKLIKNN